MSFSLAHTEGSIPVAKVKDTDNLVFFTPKNNIGISCVLKARNTDSQVCIYCDKKLASLYNLKLHHKSCKKKKEQESIGENGKSDHIDFEEKDKNGYGKVLNTPVFTTEKNRETNRDIVYICGKNGSGKSYYAGEYVSLYAKMFPDDKIVLITRLSEDTTFTKLGIEKRLHRIVVSDKILQDKFELDDFKHSLVIMDDVDSSKNSKELKKYIHRLRDDLIENGRHHLINMLITSHQITNYKDTRTVLDECSCIVLFPNMNIPYQIDRVLKTYFSMNSNQRKKIFDLPSRWVAINNKYQFITHQHGIYMMNYI